MKTERGLFEAWVKKEHTHIFNGAEQGDNRFKMDIDFMYMAWQASENREGYRLVPVEPSEWQWAILARHLGRYMQMHSRYCPKTLKKYFNQFIGEPPEWLTKEVGNWESEHAFATADLPVFIYKAMIEVADE